jgi:pimeloyl-ACP methyl ester carboxylesterase
VCLHGFTDTWRTWELVLPKLERSHEVLAPTLAGHAGGPPLDLAAGDAGLADAVEAAMDGAGIDRAPIIGNSLGGYVALQLAQRGRAESVVALAPAGGWRLGDTAPRATLAHFSQMLDLVAAAVPFVDRIVGAPEGRRRATEYIAERWEHIPAELIAHQTLGVAGCTSARELIAYALEHGWQIPESAPPCPVRFDWGVEDKLLRWPGEAARFRTEAWSAADWVVLDGVGHCPQLDVPEVTAELILEFVGR